MPYERVFSKFKAGTLHSGSKKGKVVTDPKQAVAIYFSEKRAAEGGKTEYQPKGKPKKLTGRAKKT